MLVLNGSINGSATCCHLFVPSPKVPTQIYSSASHGLTSLPPPSPPPSLAPRLHTLAARPTTATATAGDALAKVCNGTNTLNECVDALNTNPDNLTPRKLAEQAYIYLVKDGEELYKETQAAVAAAATMDEAARLCARTLNASAKYYYESVSRFDVMESSKRFDEAKANLDELLSYPSDTGASCSDRDIEKKPFVKKLYYYEDLQKVPQGLMNAANSPPKEEEAKGAKAPAVRRSD